MKKRIFCILLAVCLCFSGCSWLDGSYISVTPHEQPSEDIQNQEEEASNYLELRQVLEDMIASGVEASVIRVGKFDQERLESSLELVVEYVTTSYPLGAYAVEEIACEVGTSAGVPAVAVKISYLHDRTQIQRIQRVSDMARAEELVAQSLEKYDTSLVMIVDRYEHADIAQMVENYCNDFPGHVMEMPVVTEQTYPDEGSQRVLEVKMSYQSSRDDLRSMQSQVQKIFNAATLYVSGDTSEGQKYAQLYAFLMERFSDYQIKTSITQAYSLLIHGVGDSRAFATVYAQMCRDAGLECLVVIGTRNGEPWVWNMIKDGEYYYHVDLLACRAAGKFMARTDGDMVSYVWDYSAYPICTGAPEAPAEETLAPEGATLPAETKNILE